MCKAVNQKKGGAPAFLNLPSQLLIIHHHDNLPFHLLPTPLATPKAPLTRLCLSLGHRHRLSLSLGLDLAAPLAAPEAPHACSRLALDLSSAAFAAPVAPNRGVWERVGCAGG